MREALEKFMKVMSEERKVEITEEIVEPLPKPVPDVIAECQIVSSNYCVTTTSSQHHGISAIIPFHWQILKRLPLTWWLISCRDYTVYAVGSRCYSSSLVMPSSFGNKKLWSVIPVSMYFAFQRFRVCFVWDWDDVHLNPQVLWNRITSYQI